ncbi:MAG: ATP-binding protein, partial [Chloroflexi bacterium]|nr:ATP-binding protein [Chloroflexota bacterium]
MAVSYGSSLVPACSQRSEKQLKETQSATSIAQEIVENVSKVIVGKKAVIERALAAVIAQGHILIEDVPGVGKTMLAKRIPSILPPLGRQEALETTKIHSVAGNTPGIEGLVSKRPFRAPHHTISDVALVGGGNHPQPGEISLAHNGVLFLDELPEFKRGVLEVLRQPMEDRMITISRARF